MSEIHLIDHLILRTIRFNQLTIAEQIGAVIEGRSQSWPGQPFQVMTKRVAELTKEILARESAKRREETARQMEALIQKYKPGGNWRLLQPGPLWEACLVYIAELREVGQATVAELTKSGETRGAPPDQIEKAKHTIFDWIATERDSYIREGLKNFMQARGALVEQEALTLNARVAEELARATKDLLIQLSESAEPTKAGANKAEGKR